MGLAVLQFLLFAIHPQTFLQLVEVVCERDGSHECQLVGNEIMSGCNKALLLLRGNDCTTAISMVLLRITA